MSIRAFALLLCAIWLMACGEDDRNKRAVEKVIQKEVGKRVSTYRDSRFERCYKEAVEEASKLADSLLLIEARLSRDTAGKPPKPIKPERPELKTLKDTTLRIRPIVPDTSGGS